MPVPDDRDQPMPRNEADYEALKSTGFFDREHAKARNASEHALSWAMANQHLIGDRQGDVDKVLRAANRGILSGDEVNYRMRGIMGDYYPDYEETTSMEVPDHLGPQWR